MESNLLFDPSLALGTLLFSSFEIVSCGSNMESDFPSLEANYESLSVEINKKNISLFSSDNQTY